MRRALVSTRQGQSKMSPCLKRPSLCGSSLISLPDTGRNTSLPEGLCGAHSSTLGPLALHWGQTPPCMEALSDGRGRLRRVLGQMETTQSPPGTDTATYHAIQSVSAAKPISPAGPPSRQTPARSWLLLILRICLSPGFTHLSVAYRLERQRESV